MKIYDEVLKREETVHEEVTPENGVYIELKEPASFKEIFKETKEEDGGEQ